MSVEKVSAFGWENCARLVNEHAELIVTLDVGPRILSYKLPRGENVLRTFPEQLGKSGEARFQVRGGHRIWVAPESDRTYAPDNVSVRYSFKEPSIVEAESPAPDAALMRRSMSVSLAADSSAVMIEHRIKNEGRAPVGAASWGLTILVPGGLEVIPNRRSGCMEPSSSRTG